MSAEKKPKTLEEIVKSASTFDETSAAYKARVKLFEEGVRLEALYRGFVTAVAFAVAFGLLVREGDPIRIVNVLWAIALFGATRWVGFLFLNLRSRKRVAEIKRAHPLPHDEDVER